MGKIIVSLKEDQMTPVEQSTVQPERTRCEVYSRVVGYIRPVSQWNEGKQAEYNDRVEFCVSGCGE